MSWVILAVRIVANPLIQLMVTPLAVLKTLLNSIKYTAYAPHYTTYGLLLGCFYLPYVLLREQNWKQTSLVYADRNYYLNNSFQYNYIGMKFAFLLGFRYYLLAYLIWCVSFILIAINHQSDYRLLALFLVLFNPLIYYLVFFKSNYNVLAFVLVVPFAWSVQHGVYEMSFLIACGICLISFTAAVVAMTLVLYPLVQNDYYNLIGFIPFVCYLPFAVLMAGRNHIIDILKVIGLTGKGTERYVRSVRKIGGWDFYWFSLNLLFVFTW